MRLTLRRRILRAGLIRAHALAGSPFHPKRHKALLAVPRLTRRLAARDV